MASSPDQGGNSEEKVGSKSEDKEIDDELNKLLDSALADFDEGKDAGTTEQQQKPQQPGGAKAKPSPAGADPISDAFAEDFSDEMAKEFEDAMKQFMANDPGLLQQFEKLAEAAGDAGDTVEGEKEFDATLKETLNNLAHNTEGLQDAGGPNLDADMMKMFSGMGLEGGGADDGFMPMMQGMMKTLLSKDVLYPSLKDIADKYPDWLTKNKETITEKEYSNYKAQYDIISEILGEFDKDKETDTDDVKAKRFECVMEKMQKMQDLGQPPKEIVGDMAPGLEFDANGVPKFPGSPDGCCVM